MVSDSESKDGAVGLVGCGTPVGRPAERERLSRLCLSALRCPPYSEVISNV